MTLLKIKELIINNFGPFSGKNNIKFKDGVNIVFGGNGFGKTYLFKAINFSLFGSMLSEFGTEVINRGYIDLGGDQANVSINCEIFGNDYKINRIIKRDGKINLKFLDNNSKAIEDIYQKVPPHTAPFFLLDGEEVRQWIMSIGKNRWDTASILGFSIYQGIATDVNNIIKQLQDQIEEIERESGITSMKEDIQSLENEIEENKRAILKIKNEIRDFNKILQVIKKIRLYGSKYTEIIETIKDIDHKIKNSDEIIKQTEKRVRAKLQLLPYAFLKDHLIEALKLVDHMKNLAFDARLEQGRLYSQIELLDAISRSEKCLCDRPLASSDYGKGSIYKLATELENEMQLYETSAKAEYWPTMNLMEMRSKVELANKAAIEFDENIKNISKTRKSLKKLKNERKQITEELKIIEKKVKPLIKNMKLNNRWQNQTNIDRLLLEYERKSSLYKGRVETYKEIIDEKNNNINNLKLKMKNILSLEKDRVVSLIEAQNRLKKSLTIINNSVNNAVSEVLVELEKKVQDIFKRITNKPKEFISMEFSNTDGTPFIITNTEKKLSMQDISDGERQIVMLSLISALKHLSPTETLVVDAPFGRLDSKHIKSVIDFLPKMAPQTILFLTDREYQEIAKACQVSSVWQIVNNISGSKLEVVK